MASALYTDVKRKGNKSVFTRCTSYGALVRSVAWGTHPAAARLRCCTESKHCVRSLLSAALHIVPACLVMSGVSTSQYPAASVLHFH